MIESFEGHLRRDGLDTWFRVVGDLDGANGVPLVVCHGGPGFPHDYLESLSTLVTDGRPVVFYDQCGSGRSAYQPAEPATFFTVDLYLRELADLIDHLGVAEGYHLFGHSWGGMLALEHATRRPRGLRSLIVQSAFAASRTYTEEATALVAVLPDDVRAVLERHDAEAATDPAEYQAAMRQFYARHVCRVRPVPDSVLRSLGALEENSVVYETMAGPDEFRLTGTLAEWDIRDRLGEVDVDVLLLSGRYDEVTPNAVAELHRLLPRSWWELIDDASHLAHVEQPETFSTAVTAFLSGVTAPVRTDTVTS